MKKASVSRGLRISLGVVMLWEDRKDTKGEQSLSRLSGDLCPLQEQAN